MFDFNIHLPCKDELDLNSKISNDCSMDVNDLRKCHNKHYELLQTKLVGANFMLFNQNLPFDNSLLNDWIIEVRKKWSTAAFTQLLDFRRPGIETALERMLEIGVNGIKFHAYIQKIVESDFQKALIAARLAAERNFYICIDASYGTTWMYEYDNLRLAALIIREIKNVPIIILHSGGARYWEAMLLAEDGANVYLETSLTLPYYFGSSVESDLAFVYKKIGIERVLYASDFPFISFDASISCIEEFLEKHKFSKTEINTICHENAMQLLSAQKTKMTRI
jgi:predicted TIM-barrel fold metal-dependent hydrolase